MTPHHVTASMEPMKEKTTRTFYQDVSERQSVVRVAVYALQDGRHCEPKEAEKKMEEPTAFSSFF